MSNRHEQIAQERAAGVHEWQSDEGSTDATNIAAILDAQVEATLALVYEQRTANLIALATYMGSMGGVSKPLAKQIDERLGF